MSVPLGPMGAFCLNRIFRRGRAAGFASGMGVALGDGVFCTIAVAGITPLADFLLAHRFWLQVLAGIAIAASGLSSYRSVAPLPEEDEAPTTGSILRDMFSMMAITIANPQTILGFSIALAGLVHFYVLETIGDSLLLIGGVFSGSLLWWLMVTLLIDALRAKLQPQSAVIFQRVAAVLIVLLGVGMLLHGILSRVTM